MRRLGGRDATARPGGAESPGSPGSKDGLAVAQVETEDDPIAAQCGADSFERVEGRERLERDDDARGAEAEHAARMIDGRYAGVQPERRAEPSHRGNNRVLRRSVQDRVEVGGVQLGQAESIHVCARERKPVAGFDRRAGNRPYRSVALAPSSKRVHGTPAEQVHDADHSHGGVGAW